MLTHDGVASEVFVVEIYRDRVGDFLIKDAFLYILE